MKRKISIVIYMLIITSCMYLFSGCFFEININNKDTENTEENKTNEVNVESVERKEGKVNINDKSSYYFIINGQKYTTESFVKDIEIAGFKQDSNAAQTDIQKGSYSLNGGFFKDSTTGSTIFSVIPINNTDEAVKCADANIGGFRLEEYYYKDYQGKIEINEGITIGSTLDELIEVFGDPTEKDMRDGYDNLGMLYKYKVGMFQYFEFEIDKETNKVKVISWRCFQNQ
ncbi:MAG: hypothetical protein IKE91_01740 [Clostridia bacterium]|nr:hypothetical protein [Clostridia bacterium]